MDKNDRKVMVIPCSGIGKAFGTISREATYITLEELRPGLTDTTCLSLLVMGDPEAKQEVRELPCITVDGCPTGCARKNVELAGGKVVSGLRVVDTYRLYPQLKSQGVTELDGPGRELARLLADRIAAAVDEIKEDS